jgi:enoyl-CoA hydratase
MYSQLYDALSEIDENDDLVCVIITGAGRAFSAGADIYEFYKFKSWQEFYRFERHAKKVYDLIENTRKIVISAVNGIAFGGGLELALASDIVIASRGALMALPEIKLGLIPGTGGSQKLPRLVGRNVAKYLMLLGKEFTAERAYELGLVNEIVEDSLLLSKALEIADTIAEMPRDTVYALKRVINTGIEMDLNSALKYEQDINNTLFELPETRLRIERFVKRKQK